MSLRCCPFNMFSLQQAGRLYKTESAREWSKMSDGEHGLRAWMTGFAADPDSAADTLDRPGPLSQLFYLN